MDGEVVVVEIACAGYCEDHFIKANPEQFDVPDQLYVPIGIDFISMTRIVPALPCSSLPVTQIEMQNLQKLVGDHPVRWLIEVPDFILKYLSGLLILC